MYVRLFDGSYFRSLLYFLTFGFKKKPKTHCTACLYGMLSRIILLVRGATALLPESECKGIAFSWTTKTFTIFFSWNFKPFLTDADFQQLTKTQISGILWTLPELRQFLVKTAPWKSGDANAGKRWLRRRENSCKWMQRQIYLHFAERRWIWINLL